MATDLFRCPGLSTQQAGIVLSGQRSEFCGKCFLPKISLLLCNNQDLSNDTNYFSARQISHVFGAEEHGLALFRIVHFVL